MTAFKPFLMRYVCHKNLNSQQSIAKEWNRELKRVTDKSLPSKASQWCLSPIWSADNASNNLSFESESHSLVVYLTRHWKSRTVLQDRWPLSAIIACPVPCARPSASLVLMVCLASKAFIILICRTTSSPKALDIRWATRPTKHAMNVILTRAHNTSTWSYFSANIENISIKLKQNLSQHYCK